MEKVKEFKDYLSKKNEKTKKNFVKK